MPEDLALLAQQMLAEVTSSTTPDEGRVTTDVDGMAALLREQGLLDDDVTEPAEPEPDDDEVVDDDEPETDEPAGDVEPEPEDADEEEAPERPVRRTARDVMRDTLRDLRRAAAGDAASEAKLPPEWQAHLQTVKHALVQTEPQQGPLVSDSDRQAFLSDYEMLRTNHEQMAGAEWRAYLQGVENGPAFWDGMQALRTQLGYGPYDTPSGAELLDRFTAARAREQGALSVAAEHSSDPESVYLDMLSDPENAAFTSDDWTQLEPKNFAGVPAALAVRRMEVTRGRLLEKVAGRAAPVVAQADAQAKAAKAAKAAASNGRLAQGAGRTGTRQSRDADAALDRYIERAGVGKATEADDKALMAELTRSGVPFY